MTPVALHCTACVAKPEAGLLPTVCPASLIATASALASGSPPARMERGVAEDAVATNPRLPVVKLVCFAPTITPALLMSFPHAELQHAVTTCAPVETDQRKGWGSSALR